MGSSCFSGPSVDDLLLINYICGSVINRLIDFNGPSELALVGLV